MKIKKIMTVLTLMLAVALVTSACGSKDNSENIKKESENKEPTKLSKEVNFYTYESKAMTATDQIGKDYKVKNFSSLAELKKSIEKGDFDIAVIPSLTAAQMESENKDTIRIISPVNVGGIKVLYNGFLEGEKAPAYFSGKKVVSSEEKSTAQYVLEKTVRENGGYSPNFEAVNTTDELKTSLDSYNTFVLATEPLASKIIKENDSISQVLDIEEFWKGSNIPTDVIICSKSFAQDRADDVTVFKNDFAKAIVDDKATSKIVFYGDSNRGTRMLKDFYKEMFDFNKESTGGKLPSENIYL